jgi:hypothetical protein
LYDLRGLRGFACLCAPTYDAVARDSNCAMQVIELFRLDANRLLTTPAESFRPSQIPERDTINAVAVFHHDLNFLILTRVTENFRRSVARMHD